MNYGSLKAFLAEHPDLPDNTPVEVALSTHDHTPTVVDTDTYRHTRGITYWEECAVAPATVMILGDDSFEY